MLIRGKALIRGRYFSMLIPKGAALFRGRCLFEARRLLEEIRWYMYYLPACNRGLFKSCYCYVLFFPFKKFSKFYEKYSWFQNSVLTNIRKKSLFFEVMKNGQIFPSKVNHFQYDHRFLFSREMENIRTCKEIRLKNFFKFGLLG